MGIFSKLFTKKLAFLPAVWIRVISYIGADADSLKLESGHKYVKLLAKEYLDLLSILTEEEYKKIREAASSNPEQLYSIRFPRRLVSRVITLTLKRLSEEELSQVRAGGPRTPASIPFDPMESNA